MPTPKVPTLTKAEANRVLREILLQLDGTDWDSETPTAIAEVLTDAGFTVREPIEMAGT